MKRIRNIIILSTIILLLTGCNGNVTRDIRHLGFNLSTKKFTCSDLTSNTSNNYYKIKFATTNRAITEDGKIYELSFEQPFSNNENCKQASTDKKVITVLDNSVFKASDNKIYYLTPDTNHNSNSYTQVTTADNNSRIYSILFSDINLIKINTIDESNGIYYGLSEDGNVYKYVIDRNNQNPHLISKEVIYRKEEYGKIIDFNYAGVNNPQTFIRTEKEVYRVQATNQKECSKYADIECDYVLNKDEVLTKHLNNNKILCYGPGILITTYGKVFL